MSRQPFITYTGDGTVTHFPFRAEKVFIVGTTITYTFTDNMVTFSSPVPDGVVFLIIEQEEFSQLLEAVDPISFQGALEKLDRLSAETRELLSRAFKTAHSDTADLSLQPPSPGKYLGWNNDGSLSNKNAAQTPFDKGFSQAYRGESVTYVTEQDPEIGAGLPQGQRDALKGDGQTPPSASNPFIKNDWIYFSYPSAAMEGNSGTPGPNNKFVKKNDSRLPQVGSFDNYAPTIQYSGISSGLTTKFISLQEHKTLHIRGKLSRTYDSPLTIAGNCRDACDDGTNLRLLINDTANNRYTIRTYSDNSLSTYTDFHRTVSRYPFAIFTHSSYYWLAFIDENNSKIVNCLCYNKSDNSSVSSKDLEDVLKLSTIDTPSEVGGSVRNRVPSAMDCFDDYLYIALKDADLLDGFGTWETFQRQSGFAVISLKDIATYTKGTTAGRAKVYSDLTKVFDDGLSAFYYRQLLASPLEIIGVSEDTIDRYDRVTGKPLSSVPHTKTTDNTLGVYSRIRSKTTELAIPLPDTVTPFGPAYVGNGELNGRLALEVRRSGSFIKFSPPMNDLYIEPGGSIEFHAEVPIR